MGKSINEDIRELLDGWLESRQKRTLQVLADLTKISYNTIRRIHIGQVEPNLETCLKLLNYISTPHDASIFVENHFKEASVFYKRLLSQPATTFAPELSAEWQDFNSCILLCLAFMKLGTKDNIKMFLGDSGFITANRLCNNGYLAWQDDQLVSTEEASFFVSQNSETVNAILSHIVSILKARGETPFASIVNVSKEDLETLKKISQAYVSECTSIIENSKGSEILAISLVFTSLTQGLI